MTLFLQEKKLETHLAKVGKLSPDKLVEVFEDINYSSLYVVDSSLCDEKAYFLCLSEAVS